MDKYLTTKKQFIRRQHDIGVNNLTAENKVEFSKMYTTLNDLLGKIDDRDFVSKERFNMFKKIDELTEIYKVDNGFSPVGAGTYGCVFIPHLLTLGVDPNIPRDPRLVSKLMTDEDAEEEFLEQVGVKDRLEEKGILRDEYEEDQYLFAIGGVKEIGDLTDSDVVGYEKICKNFEGDMSNAENLKKSTTRSMFRKLDSLNGGSDLDFWTDNITPVVLKDLVSAFAKKDGLLDAIVKMNNAGVNHADLKAGNLVWKGGDSPIGIIDWGLTHVDEGDNWGSDDDFPMGAWMYNAPYVSVIFKDMFKDMMDHIKENGLGANPIGSSEPEFVTRLQKTLILILHNEKQDPSWPRGSHLGSHMSYIKTLLGLYKAPEVRSPERIFMNSNANFTTDETNLLQIMYQHVYAVYENYPDAIGDDGREFWEEVYKYNCDIWGAMTTFTGIARELQRAAKITGVKNGEYGDVDMLYKILSEIFIESKASSTKIDIPTLQASLMKFAETIPGTISPPKPPSNKLINPDYVEQLRGSFRKYELQQEHRDDYYDSNPEITNGVREVLVDWITDVHSTLDLMPETLHRTIFYIDQYLLVGVVRRSEFQLIGILILRLTGVDIDDKYIETKEIDRLCAGIYTHSTIENIERNVRDEMIGISCMGRSSYDLLVEYLKVCKADKKLAQLSCFALDSTLSSFEILKNPPSMVAAASLYMARRTNGDIPWTDELVNWTSYTEDTIKAIALSISTRFGDGYLLSVKRKYAKKINGGFDGRVFK